MPEMTIKYLLDQIGRSLKSAQESIDEARYAIGIIEAIEEENARRK